MRASNAQRIRRATTASVVGVLEAVLFDWTNTLVEFKWDDELLAAGHRAGSRRRRATIRRFTARYREVVARPTATYRPYAELLGRARRRRPRPVHRRRARGVAPGASVLASAQALLESLRERGLKTGVVANSWPEPARAPARGRRSATASRALLDVQVWSEEVGARKPEPAIFLRALAELDVDPIDAMFVGDRLDTDVQGAAAVGMTTVQALWFRADDTQGGRARLHGVHADGRAERGPAASALSAESQVLRLSVRRSDNVCMTPEQTAHRRCLCIRRTRWSAAAARSTATRSSTRARASRGRARSSIRTRRGATRTSAACRRCTTSRSTSTCCAPPKRASRASVRSARCGSRCRCATPRSSGPTRAASTRSSAASTRSSPSCRSASRRSG